MSALREAASRVVLKALALFTAIVVTITLAFVLGCWRWRWRRRDDRATGATLELNDPDPES